MNITILISTSPCEKHPSTDMIMETIDSIRYHFANERIIVMADGIRPEQEQLRKRYDQYLLELTKLLNQSLYGVALDYNWEFRHQAVMTIQVLKHVDSPLILFVEHDTPLLKKKTDWEFIHNAIRFGVVNMVRLYHEELIPHEHHYLMNGRVGTNLYKTLQWSQRPHVANRMWYKRLLEASFRHDSRCFIEDKLYGLIATSTWEEFKLAIYDPMGTGLDMKRSTNLDGRGAEPKYDQVF